jgi:hypothetical protein
MRPENDLIPTDWDTVSDDIDIVVDSDLWSIEGNPPAWLVPGIPPSIVQIGGRRNSLVEV